MVEHNKIDPMCIVHFKTNNHKGPCYTPGAFKYALLMLQSII